MSFCGTFIARRKHGFEVFPQLCWRGVAVKTGRVRSSVAEANEEAPGPSGIVSSIFCKMCSIKAHRKCGLPALPDADRSGTVVVMGMLVRGQTKEDALVPTSVVVGCSST